MAKRILEDNELEHIVDMHCIEAMARMPFDSIKDSVFWAKNFRLTPPDEHMVTHLSLMAKKARGLAQEHAQLIANTPYRAIASSLRTSHFKWSAGMTGQERRAAFERLKRRGFDQEGFAEVLLAYAKDLVALAKLYKGRALRLTQAEGYCRRLPFLLEMVDEEIRDIDFLKVRKRLEHSDLNGLPGFDLSSFRNSWNLAKLNKALLAKTPYFDPDAADLQAPVNIATPEADAASETAYLPFSTMNLLAVASIWDRLPNFLRVGDRSPTEQRAVVKANAEEFLKS